MVSPNSADARLRVVCTTGMLADAVAKVGGDLVMVEALMGPGVDPHLYRPTAGDLLSIDRAQLVVYGGLHLEGRMVEVFESLPKFGTPSLSAGDAIPEKLLMSVPEDATVHDPHIWFDVALWMRVVDSICERLGQIDPDHAQKYRDRASAYRSELLTLDQDIQKGLAKIPPNRRVLITAHDAFRYFGKRYGIEVLGIQGTSTSSEASAKGLVHLAEVIVERKIGTIFVESSVSRATIDALQEAVAARGWKVKIGESLYSDSLGTPGTAAATYAGMVRENARRILEGLQ